MNSLQLATTYLENSLQGKYITLEHIAPLLEKYQNLFSITKIGSSVSGRTIYQIKIGTGATKILAWSQMHGNEPTTTKGLFDFLNFLASDSEEAGVILKNYTFICIPILNPDGAFLYTRENAANVDLNRDAFIASQPEMKALRKLFDAFNPDLCLNLHDQRTIFGTNDSTLPATMSFLAPAFDEERNINEVRLKAISIINQIYFELQNYIPNQVGRFDDSFNINCSGDYFTYRNKPTILFEAGHFPNDYNREISRKFVFVSLFTVFKNTYANVVVGIELNYYLGISQNNKCFFDFIYKKIKIIDNCVEKIITFAAQFKERVENGQIVFDAIICQIGDLDSFYGHKTYDGAAMLFESNGSNIPKIGEKATFSLGNSVFFKNGTKVEQ